MRERTDERATLERVRGTERLYGLVVRFKAACSEGMTREHYAKFPGYAPMIAELAAAGFRDVPDYERAKASYYLLFERRARDIGLLALDNSKQVVNSEIARYSDPRGLAAVFADLEPIRDILDANRGGGAGSRAPRPSLDDARAEQRRLAARYPTLGDPALDVSALGADTPEALGALLLARDRTVLDHVNELRPQIFRNPDAAVRRFDRVRELTYAELGADEGSVGRRIVQQHMADIQNREQFRDEAMVWLSIGVGMLTLRHGHDGRRRSCRRVRARHLSGARRVGALPGGEGGRRQRARPRTEPLEPGSLRRAVHARVDRRGVQRRALGKALRPARRAIEVLERTGDVAKFRDALANARDLAKPVRAALERTGSAYADFKKALWALTVEAGGRPYSGVDPTVWLRGVKLLARHSARMGIRTFEAFVEMLKARRELSGVLRISEFTGVREYDATAKTALICVRRSTAVLQDGKYVVRLPAPPGVGRVYVANSRLPKTAGVRNWDPVAGKAVSEIFPNHVLAAFELRDGVYEISSMYPIFEP